MIPIQLTIQGLYSYQKKQTIDFTKLTAASLFGIFGTVGSGKSSILEAITFAIYGRTDRLNLSGDNRYYNMMNLKSNELLIDFIFETGKDQTAYRSVVKGKRNSKNYEDVKTLERSAYQKTGNNWIPVEITALEQAIGLSYDNFKRTIIIPQGQFQEFLQLGNRDRTQMMKELFNLGKFEFFHKVTSLESKNSALKQNIEGKLQQLGEIDADRLKEYQDQLTQLGKALEELSAKSNILQKQEAEWNRLKELTQKVSETENTLSHLRKQEAEFKKLEKTIADYELCSIRFKYLLDSLQTSSERLKNREILIRQDEDMLQKKRTETHEIEKKLTEITPDYEKRDVIKERTTELEKLIIIREIELKTKNNRERYNKGKGIMDQTMETIETLKKKKSDLENFIKVEKNKLQHGNALTEAKIWHVGMKNLEAQLKTINTQIRKYIRESSYTNQQLLTLLAHPVFKELSEQADPSEALAFLKEKNSLVKKELKTLEKEENELQIKTRLQTFADQLSEGAPCPLCGSVHHPEIYSATDSREAQEELRKIKNEKEAVVDVINKLVTQVNEINSHIKYNNDHLNEWKEKEEEQTKEIEAHFLRIKWDKYRDESTLEKEYQQFEQAQIVIKTKEDILEQLNNELNKEDVNRDRYQTEIGKIQIAIKVGESESNTIKNQINHVNPEHYALRSEEEIRAEMKKLHHYCIRLEKHFTEQSNLLIENRKFAYNLEERLHTNRGELNQERDNNLELLEQVNRTLINTEYNSIDEVKSILAHPIDLMEEKHKLGIYNEQKSFLNQQHEILIKEINSRVYDPDIHRGIITDIAANTEITKEKNQEFGKLSQLRKKLQQDLESQVSLRKELEKLEIRAENIKTMRSLFKASGFVNYISSVYLQNLCSNANDRFFQLTRQKLSLEITPENSFQVRDFMNGGKARSVKTLSGGQTFQAALSLALALAGNIQNITRSNQNFFFLDEGFGSLDKESLSVVFDTLKTLRKESRIVGVISHVEEMQQEIEVHLRIEIHEETGSLIRPGWIE